ncbi:hypothetical protein AC578_5914 [Pseudocercospora eumusae]|uniref:Mediator of RNA polymerase II transcription subunit 8 n=1 Tax=Pseudocercospora eumusae TaxID=321146 RepID=A0A139GTV7_9PEZI|nr:hypothetical protein AC578_5914 [Pseudocercospora eumusae]
MALPQDHIRAIDQLRSRLAHLSSSIAHLKGQLESNDPLPSWPTLQAASTALGSQMGELAQTLNAQRQLFTSLHPYPLPSFPGNTQEGLLQQLLRKKPEPRAEEWIEETLKIDAEGKAENGVDATRDTAAISSDEETRDLWEWAGATTAGKIEEMVESGLLDDYYSVKERREGIKNVVTGLNRQLDDSSSEGGTPESQEDVKMEDEDESKEDQKLAEVGLDPSKPPMPLEQLLKLESGA